MPGSPIRRGPSGSPAPRRWHLAARDAPAAADGRRGSPRRPPDGVRVARTPWPAARAGPGRSRGPVPRDGRPDLPLRPRPHVATAGPRLRRQPGNRPWTWLAYFREAPRPGTRQTGTTEQLAAPTA